MRAMRYTWKRASIALMVPCLIALMSGCSTDGEGRDVIVSEEDAADARQELEEAGREVGAALERAGKEIGEATREASAQLEPLLDDASITARIKTKLAADPEVNPFEIDVDTNAGVVTLTGTVGSEAARSEAEKHARQTKGVEEVQNLLRIEGDSA